MTDLVDLEDYKEYAGLTSTKEDDKLAALITSVSALVRTYCARTFNDTNDKTELHNVVESTSSVMLDEFPIISVTSVEERYAYTDAYTALSLNEDYVIDAETDSIVRVDGGSGRVNFPKGISSVKVVYSAGYPTVPEDLKLAVFDLVTYYHKDEYRGYKMLNGAATNSPGTTGQKGNVSFPDHIKRVLDLHKNIQ